MNKKIIFIFSLLILSSLLFVSSTTQIQSIPDICLQEGEGSYPSDFPLQFNLTEYINFDLTDTCYLRVRDPDMTGYMDLPAGYGTLWAECYEAAYLFNYGHDWLYFMSYSDGGCYLDTSGSTKNMFWCCQQGNCGDKFYSNDFVINVSNSCSPLTNETGGGTGGNSTLFDTMVGYYKLDETSGADVFDALGVYNASSSSGITKNQVGKIGTSYGNDGTVSEYVDLSETMIDPDLNFTVNFWWYPSSHTSGYYMWTHDNGYWTMRDNDGGELDFGFYNGGFIVANSSKLGVNQWYMITAQHDASAKNVYLYINGQLNASVTGYSALPSQADNDHRLFARQTYYGANSYIDEVSFYNSVINTSQIAELYNNSYGASFSYLQSGAGGGGTPEGVAPIQNSSLIDVTMNNSDYYSYNLDNYFWNWSDMFAYVKDPINPYYYYVWTGYCTLNADYYDLCMLANGTLILEAYARPYDYNISIFACNGDAYDVCVNDTFNVNITSEQSGVIQLQSFSYYYDVGYTDIQLFSGNYYYLYYDEINFQVVDTNATGILNSSFPFNWTYDGSDYYINYNCTINQDVYDYVALGDINLTMECGSLQSYYTFHSNNGADYNETVIVSANNTVNGTNDFFLLWSGSVYTAAVNGTNYTSLDNFTTGINYTNLFDAMPVPENENTKNIYVIVVLSAVLISLFIFFVLTFKLGALGVWLTLIITWLVAFFLMLGGYISLGYILVFPILAIVYAVIKFTFGGG